MIDTIDEIYNVYKMHHKGEEQFDHHYVGRFLCRDNKLEILEDHLGFLETLPEGPITRDTLRRIHGMMNSMYMKVIPESEVMQGEHPDHIPELDLGHIDNAPVEAPVPAPMDVAPTQAVEQVGPTALPELRRRPSVFEYQRAGQSRPWLLEFQEGHALLDGSRLESDELHHLISTVKDGTATLRYKKETRPAEMIAKMESVFEGLAKADKSVKAPERHEQLHDLTDSDKMIPELGNRKAFRNFLETGAKGVHIRINAHDIGNINYVHSREHGDKALGTMGRAIHETTHEVAGKGGVAFRIKGDTFHVVVPTHDAAAQFARSLRSKLDSIPPIGGTHALTTSMGMGLSAGTAETALSFAREAKKIGGYMKGQAKHHAYTHLMDGRGHVPTEDDSIVKPPAPNVGAAPESAPAAPAVATLPVKA